MRAIWSEAPPAPAATTISTGLVGSQAAIAGALASMAVTAAIAFIMFRTCFSPYVFVWPANAGAGLQAKSCKAWLGRLGLPVATVQGCYLRFKQVPSSLPRTLA